MATVTWFFTFIFSVINKWLSKISQLLGLLYFWKKGCFGTVQVAVLWDYRSGGALSTEDALWDCSSEGAHGRVRSSKLK